MAFGDGLQTRAQDLDVDRPLVQDEAEGCGDDGGEDEVRTDTGELGQREREEVDLNQRGRVAEEFGECGCGRARGCGRGDAHRCAEERDLEGQAEAVHELRCGIADDAEVQRCG